MKTLHTVILMAVTVSAANGSVNVVSSPPAKGSSAFYSLNRAPLLQNPLGKLPIGAIQPKGWLKEQLVLMADGMVGHLDQVSGYLANNSGWLDSSKPGWEEVPYWLKGYGDLGFLLNDPKMKKEAMRWFDAIFAGQLPNGYFGPRQNMDNRDVWPNMAVLYALQSLYEATGDKRVIPCMTKYFQWQNALKLEDLLPGSWQVTRGGDNLASVYWLYNITGDKFLLELGEKLFKKTGNWTDKMDSWHGVNFAQGFRQPGIYYQQAKDPKYLRAVDKRREEMHGVYGQMPGGLFAADENVREGKTGAQQGTETCTMVEYMNSDEELLRITGNTKWADHAEDVAFNSFPASTTPDWRGIHYLTAPNQVVLDKGGDHVYQNGGRLVSYSALETYRCCQHNIAMGWPYYSENLWLATRDNGLAAVLYAANEVTAKVGNGISVKITEVTDYPFDETVRLQVEPRTSVEFPLYLRIPQWCPGATLKINGERQTVRRSAASCYIVIYRRWEPGDVVELMMDAQVKIVKWAKQNNGVSVYRGPLAYSLKIGEKWESYYEDLRGRAWPDFEVMPTTPWNYALILDKDDPADGFHVTKGKVSDRPFTPKTAPITMTTKARRVPEWQLVRNSPDTVPASAAKTDESVEDVELIPMGTTRLRISVFPWTNN